MVRTSSIAAVAAAVATALAAAGAAQAATWHQVTPTGGGNIDEVALVRSADGVLHAGWVQKDGTNQDVATRTIDPAGRTLGPVALVAANWAGVGNPALTTGPGGLRAFFGGLHSTDPNDPNSDLNTAVSPDGGASWAVQPFNASNGTAAYASDVGAALLPSGVPITAWGSTFGLFVTTGTTPSAVFDMQGQLGGCCGYDPGLAVDVSGTPYVAWASNASGKAGVWAQALNADGSAAGAPRLMPGVLGSDFDQQLQRTPIAARAGGGVYVAYHGGYPTATRTVLWRVGAPKSVTVARSASEHRVTLSAGPDGRLWVVWSDLNGIYAKRSNKAATVFGATVRAGQPHGTVSIYRVDASAAPDGGVDVFALTSAGANSTWQARLLPGLTLRASPAKIRRGRATKVTFTVLDAGAPVSGAKVSAGGHSATTGGLGKVKLELSSGGTRRIAARATRGGYVGAKTTVRTRR